MNRITDEIVNARCDELGLQFIKTFVKNKETWINFLCPAHKDKGVSSSSWYHLRTCAKGCPYCTGRYKTTDDFKKEIQNIHPNILVIGEYRGSEAHIECKCNVDGTIWSPIARSLKNNQGCPTCGIKRASIKRSKIHDVFVREMHNLNPNTIITGEYSNQSVPISCRCIIHNVEWESYPGNLLNGSAGCPSCAFERMHEYFAMSNDEFLRRCSICNPDILVLDEYYNYYTKLRCKCIIHNKEFYQTPHGILGGKRGCTSCTTTKGEEKLNDLLMHNFGIDVINQHRFHNCKYLNALKFDAYSDKYNIAFEYNGEQHYYPVDFAGKGEEWANSQFKKNVKRDAIKAEYCLTHNIPLVIVPYWEFDNMEEFLESKLSNIICTHASSPHEAIG